MLSSLGVAVGLPDRDEVLARYVEFVAARCRPNTVLATVSDLKVFFSVIDKDPSAVTSADVFEFITAQRRGDGDGRVVRLADGGSGMAARTIRRRLAVMSGLFNWMVMCGDRAANPVPRGMATRRTGAGGQATGVPLIRTPRTLPKVLDPSAVIGLLGAVRRWRDRAMLEAMVLGLRLEDLQPTNRRVFIADGKGGHQRLIPMSAQFHATVSANLGHRWRSCVAACPLRPHAPMRRARTLTGADPHADGTRPPSPATPPAPAQRVWRTAPPARSVRLRDDLVAQQSMYRLLGDEVDLASEELGEVVLQVVDREAELGAGGENVEQVDVAVGTRLASNSGTEHGEFCEPVASAHLSETRQVDLVPIDLDHRRRAHRLHCRTAPTRRVVERCGNHPDSTFTDSVLCWFVSACDAQNRLMPCCAVHLVCTWERRRPR